MKKLLLLIIIIAVGGVMLIFAKPELVKELEQMAGFSGATDSVIGLRDDFNNTVTDIPDIGELKEGYSDVYSGALDWKNKVTDGIATTKDTIDTVRSTLSGAEDKYNQAKDTYDKAKETFEQAKETIENTTNTFDELKGTLGKVGEIGGAITGNSTSGGESSEGNVEE